MMRHIKSWEPKFKFVNPDYVVGASGRNLASSDSQGLHKRQTEVNLCLNYHCLNIIFRFFAVSIEMKSIVLSLHQCLKKV